MMQRYFWLLYLLLVTLVAVLGADMTRSYLNTLLSAPLPTAPLQANATPGQLSQKAPLSQYDIISKRNIFNANPPANTPATPVQETPPQPSLVPIQPLLVKLVGTVTGGKALRYAIIEEGNNTQVMYQIGDMVQQALIVDVRPDCVVFERQGQRETVCFQKDQDAASGKARTTVTPAQTPGPVPPPGARTDEPAASGVVRVDSGTWRVSRELILENFASVGSLATQARVVPYSVQGQPQGFVLSRLKPDSVLQQLGIQEGDVLQKVNGLDLHSPQEALQAYQQLQSESAVRLNILRGNRPLTLTYELR